jgi:hypothetical protein
VLERLRHDGHIMARLPLERAASPPIPDRQ